MEEYIQKKAGGMTEALRASELEWQGLPLHGPLRWLLSTAAEWGSSAHFRCEPLPTAVKSARVAQAFP